MRVKYALLFHKRKSAGNAVQVEIPANTNAEVWLLAKERGTAAGK